MAKPIVCSFCRSPLEPSDTVCATCGHPTPVPQRASATRWSRKQTALSCFGLVLLLIIGLVVIDSLVNIETEANSAPSDMAIVPTPTTESQAEDNTTHQHSDMQAVVSDEQQSAANADVSPKRLSSTDKDVIQAVLDNPSGKFGISISEAIQNFMDFGEVSAGIQLIPTGWTANNLHDSTWEVIFHVELVQNGVKTSAKATWSYDAESSRVLPTNDLADKLSGAD